MTPTELPDTSRRSTILQRALAIAIVLSAILVPVATTAIASRFADASSQRESGVKLVELAVSILREPPTAKAVDIRSWAMDVLDVYSGVRLSQAAREALSDSVRLPAPLSDSGGFSVIACLDSMCDTSVVRMLPRKPAATSK